jgi:hypothetical protein
LRIPALRANSGATEQQQPEYEMDSTLLRHICQYACSLKMAEPRFSCNDPRVTPA